MSQTKVDSIVQDDVGFMWFRTRFGLYRYDGYAFKVFVRDPEKSNSLDCVEVRALFKDRDGAVWAGCDQSLDRFDQSTETFKRYPIPLATHLAQDPDGLLWVTTQNGLYCLNPSSGAIHHFSHQPHDSSSISSNDLAYCDVDKAGSFWIASNAGFEEFDRRAGRVARHIVFSDVQGSHPEEGRAFGFYEDRFGLIWTFRGSPDPLSVFDRNSNTLTRYAFPDREPTVTSVQAMLEDRNGALWIATHGLGLLKLDREQRRFIRYRNIPTDPESLPQDKLDALFADREGNIWVAPGRLAPALFVTEPALFKKLPKVPGSTIEPFIGALYVDRQGVLWIGTPEALIRRDPETGQITAYRNGGPAVSTDVVSICEDGSGNLWVGTYGKGLDRFDRRTGKFNTYRHDPADPYSLSDDIVMRLLVDHKGTLWAGTADGLDRFDPATNRFITTKLDPRSLFILELIEDREGKMWIGTDSSGLRRFDPATGQIAIYEDIADVPGALSDNRINSVHFDRSGTLWVGTQNGLDKLDPQTGKFSAFTQRDGLPGNAVGCILEDPNGDLWMSTNNGVARFNPRWRAFTNFSAAEGLPGPNLTGWGACFQSPGGEMFFGGFNGGTSFFPGKINEVVDSSHAPPIVLTDFRLFGNPVQIGANSPLRKSISFTSGMILSHQQNVFSIAFAGLSYASPATHRYRYRLEGLERDWNEVGSDRRQAVYTTLPPGTYTFRAQAATRGGPWGEPGAALRIEILPPWWGAWWFKLSCVAAILAMLWAVYQLRLRQVAKEFNMTVEARVGERTRIARELHDTLLQTFHGVLFSLQAVSDLVPEGSAKERLEKVIDRAAQAITEGRDAVQDIRASTEVSNNLSQAIGALGQELAANDPSPHPAAFRIQVEGTPLDLRPLLRDEVYRIAGEELRNSFRHAQARQIEVEIRYEERYFQLIVRDDGKGLDPAVLNKEAHPGHWGLPGIHERAKLIGGKLEVWSKLQSGTEIGLTIPGTLAYTTSPSPRWRRLFRNRTVAKP